MRNGQDRPQEIQHRYTIPTACTDIIYRRNVTESPTEQRHQPSLRNILEISGARLPRIFHAAPADLPVGSDLFICPLASYTGLRPNGSRHPCHHHVRLLKHDQCMKLSKTTIQTDTSQPKRWTTKTTHVDQNPYIWIYHDCFANGNGCHNDHWHEHRLLHNS